PRRAVRGSKPSAVREPGADAQGRAAARRPRAPDPFLQPDHPQPAVLRVLGGLLPLARRADSEADAHRRLRVGDRVLHQPDLAGGGRRGPPQRAHVSSTERGAAVTRFPPNVALTRYNRTPPTGAKPMLSASRPPRAAALVTGLCVALLSAIAF